MILYNINILYVLYVFKIYYMYYIECKNPMKSDIVCRKHSSSEYLVFKELINFLLFFK